VVGEISSGAKSVTHTHIYTPPSNLISASGCVGIRSEMHLYEPNQISSSREWCVDSWTSGW
jgi:hypothetical protein